MKKMIAILLVVIVALAAALCLVLFRDDEDNSKKNVSSSENTEEEDEIDNEDKETPQDTDGLITVWVLEEMISDINDETSQKTVFEYNDRGYPTKMISYRYGNEEQYCTWDYNDQNDVIDEYWRYGDMESHCTYDIIYDNAGQKSEAVAYVGGVESGRIAYTYNEKGELSEQVTYLGDEVTRRIAFDSQGEIMEEIRYNGGEEWYHYSCTYDGRGNKIEEVTQNYDSVTRCEYVYDDQDRLIECVEYQGGSKTEYCAYDDHGNLLERILYWSPDEVMLHNTYSYVYNDEGKILEEIVYSYGEESSHSSFTYDSHGNLLEGLMDGQPFTCTYDGKGGMVFEGHSVDWPNFRLQYRSLQVTPELKKLLDEIGATQGADIL